MANLILPFNVVIDFVCYPQDTAGNLKADQFRRSGIDGDQFRIFEYLIDAEQKTVRQLWDYGPDQEIFYSPFISEADPLPETAARLQELGVRVLVFDPAANRPDRGDYMSVMSENVRRLAAAFAAVDGGTRES